MNLDAILNYQKKDIELRRILDEIERHEFNKKLDQARSEFNAAKISMSDSEKDAESIVAYFTKAAQNFSSESKRIDELESKLAALSEDDIEKRHLLIEELENARARLIELEKQIIEKKQRADQVVHTYMDSQERGKKLRVYYIDTKAKLDEIKSEREPKITAIRHELSVMKKDIDPELFEQYSALTQERKYPAVVEASTVDGGKIYSCTGCGLSLSQKGRSELINKNICRCETCRRIIFKRVK